MKTELKVLSILVLFFFTSQVQSACAVYSNNDIVIIPDEEQRTSSMVVTIAGTITSIKLLNFNGYHTCFSDNELTLTSPTGTVVKFYDHNSSCCETPLKINFDSTSLVEVVTCNYEEPNTGVTYISQPNLLSTFNGEVAAGTWSLLFNDTVGADCGFLCSWSLEIGTDGSSCPGTTPDAVDCPVFTDVYDCPGIIAAFASGGNPFTGSGVFKNTVIKAAQIDTFLGRYYVFNWVNFSTSAYLPTEGVLTIDNSAKYIYSIDGSTVNHITTGSSALDYRFKTFVLDSQAKNIGGSYYVVWNIDLDSGFCNCADPNAVGNGIGKANVRFLPCLDSALDLYNYILSHHTNVAVIISNRDVLTASIVGSTKFSNSDEVKSFFLGSKLAKDLAYCPSICSI